MFQKLRVLTLAFEKHFSSYSQVLNSRTVTIIYFVLPYTISLVRSH